MVGTLSTGSKTSAKRVVWRFVSKSLTTLGLGAQARKIAFRAEFSAFRRLAAGAPPRFSISWEDRYPCLGDQTEGTGFDRHYVYHTAWAARVLARLKPSVHVDVSSSLYFCGMLSAFIPVKFYDYRPADLRLSNLTSEAADLLALPFADESVEAISCMHVVEHVGLGRYGDPLDPEGDLKAMRELKRVLAPGGTLLFVVPTGKPRIMFNAHRIYSFGQIKEYFAELELREFALIPDSPQDGGLIFDAPSEVADAQSYGCGCFWFVKK
jgi:SAM-dependent methyltransferase